MIRNKAALYQISDPHSKRFDPQKRVLPYRVGIGTWKAGKFVTVKASSVEEAVSKGRDFCGRDDEVIEVRLGGKVVWDLYERMGSQSYPWAKSFWDS